MPKDEGEWFLDYIKGSIQTWTSPFLPLVLSAWSCGYKAVATSPGLILLMKEKAISSLYQNKIKHHVPYSLPPTPAPPMWYSSPPIFHGPLWISKLSRLTGLKIFLPGHSWNRSGLRATYTAPLQPLQTKPALHNCHLNAKHFSLGWSVPFVHTFLRKVVLLEHNIFTCFTACWAWAAGIVSYSQNLHRIINGVLLSILLQCIDIVLLFPTKPTHQCNGICSCDGIRSVWWVNFPSALSRAEKWPLGT